MRYIECPTVYTPTQGTTSLFLAGGISGCPDWQADVVSLLDDVYIDLLNPRRKNFPIHDPQAAKAQITWEHDHLRLADGILFWFPCETMCPIVLYELGAHSMTDKPLFVGVHPKYSRKQDVEIQTLLARPNVRIVDNIPALVRQVRQWAGERIRRMWG